MIARQKNRSPDSLKAVLRPVSDVDIPVSEGSIKSVTETSVTVTHLALDSGLSLTRSVCEIPCEGDSVLMADTVPTIEKRENVTCILLGEGFENLDEQILESIRGLMLETAAEADPPRVVVDLPYTKFFGSSFIEVLFRVWNRINGLPGGRFSISGLTPYCQEVLEVTHLDKLWELHDNLDDAVAALKG